MTKQKMPTEKLLTLLTITIIILSAFCCILPLITDSKIETKTVFSVFDEEITLYGKGIYARNSISMAAQAIAQDFVTLILALPFTIISLIMIKKKNILGNFILTGLLAYLLYTYMSYSFLMIYNELFLIYVILMASSFYAFVLSLNILAKKPIIGHLEAKMNTKGLRIFLFITGIMISFLWLSRILPTIGTDRVPEGLEFYSTLVIQALDLGVVVPACFSTSYLLKIKHHLGYILGPVIIIKAATLVGAVLSMGINMRINGVYVAPVEFVVFGTIFVVTFYFLIHFLRIIAIINRKV